MIEIICLGGIFVAMITVFFLQTQHAKERAETLSEIREMASSHADALGTHMRVVYGHSTAEREAFLTNSLSSMRDMYKSYVDPVLQAASVLRASSTTEGAMAAGTLAQTAAALDPELQQRMFDIQEKVNQYRPFQQQEPAIPKIPEIIQDPETGDILKRMV
jgi:hypothetical protein